MAVCVCLLVCVCVYCFLGNVWEGVGKSNSQLSLTHREPLVFLDGNGVQGLVGDKRPPDTS